MHTFPQYFLNDSKEIFLNIENPQFKDNRKYISSKIDECKLI